MRIATTGASGGGGMTPNRFQVSAEELKESRRQQKRAPEREETKPSARPPAKKMTLHRAAAVFRKWLGSKYDLDALRAVLATAAAERLDGDPLWLLLVSGSGNAKTETVISLAGVDATITSTIASEGALLSATAKRERGSDATGGLLRKMGDRGVLVIKDVTSLLSMNRDTRAMVLAAIREIHDGRWERNVGTDGGRSLTWTGRIAIVGAVTTAWDQAHAVISSMGDRFVLLRMDSSINAERLAAGRRAIRNTGSEIAMREELAGAMAGVLASLQTDGLELTDAEQQRLLGAANVVTLARTGVEYDYRGDVIDAHAPEMPTRFAKQLAQMMRGGLAIGMGRRAALKLALRCARDSVPPLRLAILRDIADWPGATTTEVRRRLQKPHNTVDRQLQALQMLGLVKCQETEAEGDRFRSRWYWWVADGVDARAVFADQDDGSPFPEMSPHGDKGTEERDTHPVTDKSGNERVDPFGADGPDESLFYTSCPQCGGQMPVARLPRPCVPCSGGVQRAEAR